MLTYNNDPAVKQMYIDRMKAHMEANELVRGGGYNEGKGCFIGYALNVYNHKQFRREIAPEWLAWFVDKLHENTSEQVWPTLGLRVLEAIPVGEDISHLEKKMKVFVLEQVRDLAETLDELGLVIKKRVLHAINHCIDVQKKESYFDEFKSASWSVNDAQSVIIFLGEEAGCNFARALLLAAKEAAWPDAFLDDKLAEAALWTAEAAAVAAKSVEESQAAKATICDSQAEYLLKILSEVSNDNSNERGDAQ